MTAFGSSPLARSLWLSFLLPCAVALATVHALSTAALAEPGEPPSGLHLVRSLPQKKSSGFLAFSPDGKIVATSGQKSLCLWDTATGKLRKEYTLDGFVYQMAFMAEGKLLACRTGDLVTLLDAQTGERVGKLNPNQLMSRIFPSPDGNLIAFYTHTGTHQCVQVWNVLTRNLVWHYTTPWHDPAIKELSRQQLSGEMAFAPDGKTLAVTLQNGLIRVHRAADGKVLRTFSKNDGLRQGGRRPLAFSPDGKVLAVGEPRTERIRIWEYATGEWHRDLRWHPESLPLHVPRDNVWNLAFCPDGLTLAATFGNGWTRIWDMSSGQVRQQAKLDFLELAYSPNGLLLGLSQRGRDEVRLYDAHFFGNQAAEPLTPKQLETCWQQLAAAEAAAAYVAAARFAAQPKQVIPFLQQHLQPAPAVSVKEMEKMVAQLDAKSFQVRSRAFQELEKLDRAAEPILRQAFKQPLSAEAKTSMEELLQRLLQQPAPEKLRRLRAIEILEYLGTAEATAILDRLAQGTPGTLETESARLALRCAKTRIGFAQ